MTEHRLINRKWHTGNWDFNTGNTVENLLEHILKEGFNTGAVYGQSNINWKVKDNKTISFTATVPAENVFLFRKRNEFAYFSYQIEMERKEFGMYRNEKVKIKGKAEIKSYFTSSMSAMPTTVLRSELEVTFIIDEDE